MRRMDHEFRTYIRHSATVNFVLNLLINAALGWWLLREHQALTPFGAAAYGPDLLITGFLLSLIVATIVIETHRRKAARGDMKPVALAAGGWLDAASRRGRLANGTAFGVLGTLVSVAPLTLLMATTASLSVPVYAGIKGVWAGLLAAAIVAPATAIGLSLGARQAARA
jgi:hypothetical protein